MSFFPQTMPGIGSPLKYLAYMPFRLIIIFAHVMMMTLSFSFALVTTTLALVFFTIGDPPPEAPPPGPSGPDALLA